MAGSQTGPHRRTTLGLHPIQLHLGFEGLEGRGNPGHQPTPTNGHYQYRDLGQVVQNFQSDGALARHHLVIIEGGNGGKALLMLELQGMGHCIVKG